LANNASQLSWIAASSGGSGWPSLVIGFASAASVRFVIDPATCARLSLKNRPYLPLTYLLLEI
jgi:hypothetical protein